MMKTLPSEPQSLPEKQAKVNTKDLNAECRMQNAEC